MALMNDRETRVDNSGFTPNRIVGPAGIQIKEAHGSDTIGSTCAQYNGSELKPGDPLPSNQWVVRAIIDGQVRCFAFPKSELADDAGLALIVHLRKPVIFELISRPKGT